MYPNWKFSKIDVSSPWQSDEIQNNCDKCGKLYRYNWRRRRTREKTCNLCVNEVKCNAVFNMKRDKNNENEAMNFENKPTMDDNPCLEKKTWDAPLPMFPFAENISEPRALVSDSMKKLFGFQELTDQLLYEMKMEFGEELRNSQKPFRIDFDWPSTSHLTKVDCLRAFNIMKQILLKEMNKCRELCIDPLVLRRKFYLERRFQSLEKEKIRRLKIYESLYIQEEVKNGYEYLCKS